jgi:thiopurine S-methyltransferase
MKANFWHDMWATGKVGFHRTEVNEFLQTYWAGLDVPKDGAVLVPLCGKSLDMCWLAEQGYSVLGVELSQKAIHEFLEENDLTAQPIQKTHYDGFQIDNMTLLCGDIFNLTPTDVQKVKAVYDRAALVALPPEMRVKYTQHLANILPAGTQIFLITMEYSSPKLQGPPFSVLESEVESLYGDHFKIDKLFSHPIVRQGEPVEEKVFKLTKVS